MQNLKIKVNNETESKEVQELLFELGYKWHGKGKTVSYLNDVTDGAFSYLVAWSTGCFTNVIQMGCGSEDAKETTIAELRDMVKPMKEYLIPSRNYKYILTDAREALEPHAKDWIEIPEGAEVLSTDGDGAGFIFWKDDFNLVVGLDDHWDETFRSFKDFFPMYPRCKVLWQRPQQPEALPFIDDNPQSINDQYAEIEKVRQEIKVKSGSNSDHALDAMSFGLMGLSADANHAQQQTIEATLAERQSTYGNFEDVAFVTENIMVILSKARTNGLTDLPHTHRMALYMIASKMARIVNGDFNSIDGWHDIGGYSKLIENLVKELNNG